MSARVSVCVCVSVLAVLCIQVRVRGVGRSLQRDLGPELLLWLLPVRGLAVCLPVCHSLCQTNKQSFFLLLLLPFLPSVLIVERGEKKKNRQEEARVRVCGKVE